MKRAHWFCNVAAVVMLCTPTSVYAATITSGATDAQAARAVSFATRGRNKSLGPAAGTLLLVNPGAVGSTFDIDVVVVDANDLPVNLTTSTNVALHLVSGTGTLGGTTSGTIPAGSFSTTIHGVTYDAAESEGIIIEVVPISGETLATAAGSQAGFWVEQTTLTVTTTADVGPGSLREAITAANAGRCGRPCTIKFAPGGTGTIVLTFPLPAIQDPGLDLTIDGYTAAGASPNTAAFGEPSNASVTVTLDGDSGGVLIPTLLDIESVNVTVRGLAFHNFGGEAIRIGGNVNTITGCLIGTDGFVARPNKTGIVINGWQSNQIGGPAPADRNVISGNTKWGILIEDSIQNIVEGNYIGVNAAATASVAFLNAAGGVMVSGNSFQNIIRNNVISGHTDGVGLVLNGIQNDVENNRIGTDGTGTAAVPNSTGMIVHEESPITGNVISGNSGVGVVINADPGFAQLFNNRIGIGATLGALGNGSHGVSITGTGIFNQVTQNVIAHNGGSGVSVTTTGYGTLIRFNDFFANTGLAIDLGDDGATPNDPGDGDTNQQNFPVISTAAVNGSAINVTASLDSSQASVQPGFFTIDVYKVGAAALEYLGSSGYLSGPVLTSYTFSVPAGSAIVGDQIVALATSFADDTGSIFSTAEGTSEFSPPFTISGVKHWIAASGTWETASSWSPAGVPTSSDTVFIDNGGTYTVTINSPVAVHSLTVGGASGIQTLQVSAGQSLSIASASNVTSSGALSLDGTSLNGAGSLDVDGTLDWRAGSIGGTGGLAIRAGGVLDISTSATKILDHRTLTIQSGATAHWNGGTIQLQNAASIANGGGFLAQTSAALVNGGGAGAFVNNGVVAKSGAGTTIFDGVAFQHNGGALEIDSGVVELAAGGSASAQIELGFGSELRISTSTYTFASGTTVSTIGADGGLVHITTGQLDVNATMTIPRLQLEDGGTLAGNGLLQYGTFTWNGGTMSGAGTTQGPTASTITFPTAATKSLRRTLQILAGGNAVVPDSCTINLDAGGSIQNAGTWSSQTDYSFSNGGSAGPFTNTGIFRQSTGAGTVSFDGVDFNNTGGAVDLQGGNLRLGHGTSTGTFALNAGTTVRLDSGLDYTLAASTSSSGAGTFLVSSGLLTIQDTPSLANLTLAGGRIDGPGTLTLTGNGIWSSGAMQGPGTTVVANGSTLAISTGSSKSLMGRNLDTLTGGTIDWTDGLITVSLAAKINNAGLFRARAGNVIENTGGGPFTNMGMLQSTVGTFIGIPLANTTGTLDLQNGILYTSGGYTQGAAGTLKVHLGGTALGTQYSQLATPTTPTLGGTLQILLAGAYQPAGGDTFQILSFNGAHNGDFIRPFTYPSLTGGRTFQDAYDPLKGLVLTVIGAPDLSITKTASAPSVAAGALIRYTLTVNNGGTDPAVGVHVTDVLPTGHTGITASGGTAWSCQVAGDTVTCDAVNPLGSGNAPDIVIDAHAPTTEQTLTNTATVTSTNDPNGANNSGSATVTVSSNEADVYLSSTEPAGPVLTATPLALAFSIGNNGPQTATSVRFTITIPPSLTYNSAFVNGSPCSFATPVVYCAYPSLSPSFSIPVTINVTASASGTYNVVANAGADQNDPIFINNTLTYPITVTNNGVRVGNTNDSGPGSLRQALLDASSGTCAAPCIIAFNIPAPPPPPYRIRLLSDLPDIASGVTIDATTAPGYSGVPLIEIDGSSITGSAHLLNLAGDGSVVRGLSIINGAADGILISGNDNRIESCYIGLTSGGTPAPNHDGIRILGSGNIIGGQTNILNPLASRAKATTSDVGNVIANNTGSGIIVIGGSGNEIIGNSIHGNSSLGIDLGGDGPDENDPGDADDGANGKQNSPTLTSAGLDGLGNLIVHYGIDSSATPANSIRVEIFEADSVTSGEGMSFLTGVCIPSNHFSTTTSFAVSSVAAGDPIVATATSFTDNACTTIGSGTSELSNVIVVANDCALPSANVSGSAPICAGGSATITATLTGTPPFNVTWSDGVSQTIASGTTASRTVSPAGTTTYTVTSVTDASCVTAGTGSGSAVITVSPLLVAAINAPVAVPPSSTGNTASVPAQDGAVYAWTITNGVITSGANSNAITFTADPSGDVVLGITVDNGSCTSTGSATVAAIPADIPALSTWMLLAFGIALAALAVRRIH